jgi:oligopeptidase B
MKRYLLFTLILLNFAGCKEETSKEDKMIKGKEPLAEKVDHEIVTHGDKRIDPYFWMRLSDEQKESKNPDEQTKKVIDYLNDENDYLNAQMAHTEKFQEKLYHEIVNRIPQRDESVPVVKNGYEYAVRYEEGEDYALHVRKSIDSKSTEEVLLNIPELAKDHAYYALASKKVSPNNKRMVYGVDTVSRRQYTLYVKDLETGKLLTDVIPNTTGSAVWANDNETIFYTRKDSITLRACQIFKHKLGTNPEDDELVFEEKDETFSAYVFKSKSQDFIFIGSYQTISSEVLYIKADQPDDDFKVIIPRERNHEYDVDHYGDDFYITTNKNALNFKLVKAPIQNPSYDNWTEVIPHRNDVFLENIELFRNFLVVEERKDGLTHLRVMPWEEAKEDYYIAFNDPTYMSYIGQNPEFNTDILRFGYSSLTTPHSIYDYNMVNKEKDLKKQTKVLDDNFSPENYKSERLYAVARDGAKVPISIVYKKGFQKDGKAPLLLYGYGSYGNSIDPYFSSVRLSLLDRGFAFAIAHIRGGQEMGRAWYEDGKLLKKKNTFYDFIDCAEYLIDENYTAPQNLFAQGGSAGGLLVGAVMNMRPDLWKGVLAGVPFVDVVSTMLDETIPLTTGEFDEWGNPKNEEYYNYMLSYSPYDNIEEKAYPNLLITTGYWDSQVQYWEPAKWIAKLRDKRTNENKLFMYCNMDVGHGGASGRFEKYKEVALEYAFILDLAGRIDK